jgi:Zn-dependent metalloprotease
MTQLTEGEIFLFWVIVANTAISFFVILWGAWLLPAYRKLRHIDKPKKRLQYVFRGMVILVCPVLGIAYFSSSELFRKLFFRKEVDLAGVIFSKEHVETMMKADEERGRNLAPLEETMAVSDKDSLRGLMMNVIRGDTQKSLAAIALALNSQDSETAHYAASVLRDELNGFRMQVQKLFKEIKSEEDNQEAVCVILIEYMNDVMEQRVFADVEQHNFVMQMEEACDILYQKDQTKIESNYYEWICMRLMEIKEYDMMEKWAKRSMEQYPDELSSYTCMLKLYYSTQNQERFFQVLNDLKKSPIVLDNSTLDLIRVFS